MASIPISPALPPETVQQVLHVATPATFADYAALCLLSIVSATLLSRGIVWDTPDPYARLSFERPQLKNGGADGVSTRKETRDIARKLDESGKNIVIFWGSQSGTSEGFAHRLGRELHGRLGQETLAADLSDYDPETIALIPKSTLAIFIVSTYGEGDPSDNAAEFWEWVTTKAQSSSLAGLQYVAFGLGNTNYKFYNRVVDVVVSALDRLGATALMPAGKANDAEGSTAEDFMSWKDELIHVLVHKLGMTEREMGYLPTVLAEPDESLEPIDLHHGEPASTSPARAMPVSRASQLLASSDRHCLHLELDLNDQPLLTYKTGDHLAVWPANPNSEVDALLQTLDLFHRRHVPISIKPLDPTVRVPVPTPTTYEALFRHYLEIGAPLNRDSILGLAQFAPSPDAKAFLLTLGQSRDAYAEFVGRTHVTLGRLLRIACPTEKWSTIPLSLVVESLPQIQPRYYSISSSSVVSPRTPSITVAVSQTPIAQKPEETINGITSNYLLALSHRMTPNQPYQEYPTYPLDGPNNALHGGKIFAHIRKNKFKLPASSNCPLVMVAAGTGLAPFRGFLAERCRLQQIGKPVGEMILFFGCRHPDEDFIYRDELEEMERGLGGKLRIITAFSRAAEPRLYVQDRIREAGSDVVRLLDDGASLYICGRAAMAREVEKGVEDAMRAARGWEDDAMEGWTKGIKRQRKWQEDVWG
jgi:NADPH-ferrihemoprotein reductase